MTDVTWQWSRDPQTDIPVFRLTAWMTVTRRSQGPPWPATRRSAADDGTKFLRVTASYTDAEGVGKTAAECRRLRTWRSRRSRNLAPVFTDEDDRRQPTVSRSTRGKVAEDADAPVTLGAPNVGADRVVATDDVDAETNDGHTLYLLSGADAASFT